MASALPTRPAPTTTPWWSTGSGGSPPMRSRDLSGVCGPVPSARSHRVRCGFHLPLGQSCCWSGRYVISHVESMVPYVEVSTFAVAKAHYLYHLMRSANRGSVMVHLALRLGRHVEGVAIIDLCWLPSAGDLSCCGADRRHRIRSRASRAKS